jgi:hypothetical protein
VATSLQDINQNIKTETLTGNLFRALEQGKSVQVEKNKLTDILKLAPKSFVNLIDLRSNLAVKNRTLQNQIQALKVLKIKVVNYNNALSNYLKKLEQVANVNVSLIELRCETEKNYSIYVYCFNELTKFYQFLIQPQNILKASSNLAGLFIL